MKVVAIVGLTGSGKSEAARIFEEKGFAKVRFGDITDDEIRAGRLELNEENERRVRELLRQEQGMAAYAIRNLPKIDEAVQQSDVVVDGLYSWEEYLLLKNHYGDNFCVVAVWASPKTRYRRLAERLSRPLTFEQAESRDVAEIENIDKAGPIAMADFTFLNESSLEDLRKGTERIISILYEETTKIDR